MLLEALQIPLTPIRANAAALLCLCPDTAAIDPLARLVCAPDDVDLGAEFLGEVAAHALACIGPPALAALERLARLEIEYNPAYDALVLVAATHAETRERIAGCLQEVMRRTGSQELRSLAVDALRRLDWRPALAEAGRLLDEGRLDEAYYGRNDHEAWVAGRGEGQDLDSCSFPQDPLERFVEGQHDVLSDYRYDFSKRVREGLDLLPARVFRQDAAALCVQPVRTAPRVGRNDPCPCGSGKKHKKCCLEAAGNDRQGCLLRRIPQVQWQGSGYAWKLSEQFERLPLDDLERGVDLLMASARELDALGAGLDTLNDYLLWAVASRYAVLGQRRRAQDLAVRIAASEDHHPALDYAAIERFAVLSDPNESTADNLRVQELDDYLRLGYLSEAWIVADGMVEEDPAEGLAAYLHIWNAWPHVLWTPLAMAEALMWHCPEDLVLHLEKAIDQARQGLSRDHPLLPGRACPLEILEWQLGRVREAQEIVYSNRALLNRSADDPMSLAERAAMQAIVREVRLQERLAARPATLEDGTPPAGESQGLPWYLLSLRSQVNMVLERWSGQEGRRWPVFVGEWRQGEQGSATLVCILPVRAAAVSAADGEALACTEAPRVAAMRGVLSRVSREWLEVALQPVAAVAGEWVVLGLPCPAGAAAGTAATCLEVLCGEDPVDEVLGSPWPIVLLDPMMAALLRDLDPRTLDPGATQAGPGAEEPAAVRREHEEETHVPWTLRGLLKRVLTRLIRMNKIGAAHTEIGYFWRGVPTSWRGALKDLLDILVAHRFVRLKPTIATPHISLEPARLPDIFRFLEQDVIPCPALQDYLVRHGG